MTEMKLTPFEKNLIQTLRHQKDYICNANAISDALAKDTDGNLDRVIVKAIALRLPLNEQAKREYRNITRFI